MDYGCKKCNFTGYVPGILGFSWSCDCSANHKTTEKLGPETVTSSNNLEINNKSSESEESYVMDHNGNHIRVGSIVRVISSKFSYLDEDYLVEKINTNSNRVSARFSSQFKLTFLHGEHLEVVKY